jgi:uncharacterized protein
VDDHRQPDGARGQGVEPDHRTGAPHVAPLSARLEATATLSAYARVIRPLEERIRAEVRRTGVLQPIVEKDYALGHTLAAIALHPVLAETLVFKGGTALKKLYFEAYRFSEDLDFSAVNAPRGDEMEAAVRAALEEAVRSMNRFGQVSMRMVRHTEKRPHPGGQDSFEAGFQFPWQPQPYCKIKVEVTHDEPVLLEPARLPLRHGYDEELPAELRCYRLEEVLAEKLRTLLQTQQKLARRGWNRPRARDYYDLWRILTQSDHLLDAALLPDLVARKCAHRGVTYTTLDDFFTEQLVREARANWRKNLGAFITDLPACDPLLSEVRTLLAELFPSLAP